MQRLLDPSMTPSADVSHTAPHAAMAATAARRSAHADRLARQVEWRMAAACPRLLRLARAQGVPPDSADDVAQETLLEAWRHLAALSASEGFDAWLTAICRNVCRRYLRGR